MVDQLHLATCCPVDKPLTLFDLRKMLAGGFLEGGLIHHNFQPMLNAIT